LAEIGGFAVLFEHPHFQAKKGGRKVKGNSANNVMKVSYDGATEGTESLTRPVAATKSEALSARMTADKPAQVTADKNSKS